MSQTILKLPYWKDAPENYTGIVDRTDGVSGPKEWWIDGKVYFVFSLNEFIEQSVFLGKEKGIYDLYWLKFLTENGIEEFPIIPGMEKDEDFIEEIKKLKYGIKT